MITMQLMLAMMDDWVKSLVMLALVRVPPSMVDWTVDAHDAGIIEMMS